MKYTYLCSNCSAEKEFELTIEEYSKFVALCEDCGTEMTRVYAMPAVKGGSADSGDDGGQSGGCCSSGGCSSCAGCAS